MRWHWCRALPLLAVVACAGDGAGATGSVAVAVVTYDIVPAAVAEGEESGDCAAPLSDRYTLAAGEWRSESRWYADCLDSTRPRTIVVHREQGTYTVHDGMVVLQPAATAGAPHEEDPIHGTLRGDTLTLYGHCDGEAQYTRLPGLPRS